MNVRAVVCRKAAAGRAEPPRGQGVPEERELQKTRTLEYTAELRSGAPTPGVRVPCPCTSRTVLLLVVLGLVSGRWRYLRLPRRPWACAQCAEPPMWTTSATSQRVIQPVDPSHRCADRDGGSGDRSAGCRYPKRVSTGTSGGEVRGCALLSGGSMTPDAAWRPSGRRSAGPCPRRSPAVPRQPRCADAPEPSNFPALAAEEVSVKPRVFAGFPAVQKHLRRPVRRID